MDKFKMANVVEFTSYDIGVKCVCYSDKAKARDKRTLSRLARRRLKRRIIEEGEN